MSEKSENIPEKAGSYDWFMPAIRASGNVKDCLDAVISEIDEQKKFIQNLQNLLTVKAKDGSDSITEIGRKVRLLKKTLAIRAGVLNSMREQSWFRASTNLNLGPFSAAILDAPVFCKYHYSKVLEVKTGLIRAWHGHKLAVSVFSSKDDSLWSFLLKLNHDLEGVRVFSAPFSSVTLDKLSSTLPDKYVTKSLKAFAMNVQSEYNQVRQELDECYRSLFAKSEELWVQQAIKKQNDITKASRNTAQNMREEFSRRRSEQAKSRLEIKTPLDFESLNVMGFEDFPSKEDLKKRYYRMAKESHPDRSGSDGYTFKRINKAYKHLSARV